jgi:type II secretory pathway component PulJ
MKRTLQRGFTMGEVLLVTSLLSFATTGVMTLVSKKSKNSNGEQYYKQMVMDGRGTVDQIAKELRVAGVPSKAANPALTFTNSNKVAANTFLVANSDQIVFEADLDHNGAVERIEYRLKGDTLERSAVTKNEDGSLPPSSYEVVAERVDNGGLPVFTFDGDYTGEKPVAPDPQQVRVMLLLRSPVRDRKSGRARTVGFEAVALRNVQNPTTSPAGKPEQIEASTPDATPATPSDVAGSTPTATPAGVPTAENHPADTVDTDARNSLDPRDFSLHQLLDLPVIYPAEAVTPAADENSVAGANSAPLRAALVIATTGKSALPASDAFTDLAAIPDTIAAADIL